MTVRTTCATCHPSLLRGRDMLCFSHDWNGDPLSKTHLMRLLARHNRVLWVNSIGYRAPTASRRDVTRAVRKVMAAAAPLQEVEPNLHVVSPLVIPAYGRPWIADINRWLLRQQVQRAMRQLAFTRPINWVFNPAASIVAGSLGEELLIYYCVDEYAAFSGVDMDALAAMERALLTKADLVIASSTGLYESKLALNPRTVLVRHGVDWTHFRSAQHLPPHKALAGLSRPLLGYFGLIAEDWVDVELISHVATSLPHASIVMLGKITMDVAPLRRFKNVHLLGRQPYESLPAFCAGFDVALIPFPINTVTLNANPLKAREYLAAGLPVVSTAVPEVEVLNHCRIGRDPASFVAEIELALANPGPSAARSDALRQESWEHRLVEIDSHVANVCRDQHALPHTVRARRAA
ncbi:MAG: glycosyltransferase [Phycisphaerae bacterium]|nr:glycosyltransferase [Phycisphaerae bacterium]